MTISNAIKAAAMVADILRDQGLPEDECMLVMDHLAESLEGEHTGAVVMLLAELRLIRDTEDDDRYFPEETDTGEEH